MLWQDEVLTTQWGMTVDLLHWVANSGRLGLFNLLFHGVACVSYNHNISFMSFQFCVWLA